MTTPTVSLNTSQLLDDAIEMNESENVLLQLIPLNPSRFHIISVTNENTKDKQITLGKEMPNFDDHRISTNHCSLFCDDDEQVCIVDLSTNGTFVNGERLEKNGTPRKLINGDEISLVINSSKHVLASKLPAYLVHTRSSAKSEQRSDATLAVTETVSEESASSANNKRKREAGSDEEQSEEPPKKVPKQHDEETKRILAMLGASSQEDTNVSESQEELIRELSCSICSEIYYKPVSVLPCLHNFCASCLGGWRKQNNTCPTCRVHVTQVKKNHSMNNVIDKFLKMNPQLKRPDEELQELDKSSELFDTVNNESESSNRLHYHSSQSSSDSESDIDSGSDSDTDTGVRLAPISIAPVLFNNSVNLFNQSRLCTECATPGIDGFQCQPNQMHITCVACLKQMPHRTDVPLERSQQCAVCQNYFCDLYTNGGCPNRLSGGALKKLSDFTDIQVIPFNCMNNNNIERQVLIDYMNNKQLSVQDVFEECCRKLESGEFTLSNSTTSNPSTATVPICCRSCALIIFSDLLYSYRISIPRAELPNEIAQRPDCWYGRECRTAQWKPDHARRFNHACENQKRR